MGKITTASTQAPAKPAPAGAPPKPSAAAAPGTADESGKKVKKVKVERVDYVAPEGADFVNADGKFTALPPDWDRKKHKNIKRNQFADESAFLIMKAEQLEKQAADLREEAKNVGKMGNVKDKVKAKRLLQLQKRMKELEESLAADMTPEDLAELMGSVAESLKPKEKPAAETETTEGEAK